MYSQKTNLTSIINIYNIYTNSCEGSESIKSFKVSLLICYPCFPCAMHNHYDCILLFKDSLLSTCNIFQNKKDCSMNELTRQHEKQQSNEYEWNSFHWRWLWILSISNAFYFSLVFITFNYLFLIKADFWKNSSIWSRICFLYLVFFFFNIFYNL